MLGSSPMSFGGHWFVLTEAVPSGRSKIPEGSLFCEPCMRAAFQHFPCRQALPDDWKPDRYGTRGCEFCSRKVASDEMPDRTVE